MLLFFPALAVAEALPARDNSQKLIITELKVKTDSSYDEFIELYNNGLTDLDLSNYYLEYCNVVEPLTCASSTPASTKTEQLPQQILAPNDFIILAIKTNELNGSLPLSSISSLKDTEGSLRLYLKELENDTVSTVLIDELSWKHGDNLPEGAYDVPTLRFQSLQRITKSDDVPVVFEDGWVAGSPTPGSIFIESPPPPPIVEPFDSPTDPVSEISEQIVDDPQVPETDPVVETEPVPLTRFLPLQITELLPNPAPPFTDALDEFVEIYNPNDQPIDLTGYKVQTGNTYSYSYELSDLSLSGDGYLTLTSGNTNLSLANTGGKARLLDPNGVVVAETMPYENAPEGQAWALINALWAWTTTATPARSNTLTTPVPIIKPAKKTVVATKTIKKTPIAKKASTKKVSAKISSAKKSAVKSAATARDDETDPPMIMPLHTGVLAAVGVFALVYAGYEYRQDMANQLYRFSRYRETRRAARAASSGRRSH